MRFLLTLHRTSKRNFLSFNNQYFISSWIYKRIAEADAEFANFLHQNGYGEGNRKFKLFTFGQLDLKPYQSYKDRGVMEMLGSTAKLEVSFHLPKAAEEFIKGLFLNQHVGLGDRINQIDFEVGAIEALPVPAFEHTMRYRTLTPVSVSKPAEEGEKYSSFLAPDHPEFVPRLLDNLIYKYMAAKPVMVGEEPVDREITPSIKILTENPKSKLTTIRPMMQGETKVRGYLFDFELTAPKELHELVYAAGLGESNAMGMGYISI